MKTVVVVTLVIAGLFVLFQTYITMATHRTEVQPYTVVQQEKEFEIRHYPPAILATYISTANTYDQLSTSGFQTLANYIFGGNRQSQKIAMTAPVHMDINDSSSSMSFVMPSAFDDFTSLPTPNNSNVKINTKEEEYVAAIRFGGYVSDKKIEEYSAQLRNALKASSIAYFGNIRYLGYNPPYQLLGRRNELIVSVVWNKK